MGRTRRPPDEISADARPCPCADATAHGAFVRLVAPQPLEGIPFPVVGIGASAGGLEAFTQLLKALPADTGMAFVLVQHLDPTHESQLPEVLARTTACPSSRSPTACAWSPITST